MKRRAPFPFAVEYPMSSSWWQRWFLRRSSCASGRRRAPVPRSRRPQVEALEDRTLLSTSIPLDTSFWQPLGPSPLANGQTPGHQPVSGRITGIATDAVMPNTIFVATAGGGVWRTDDAGTTWFPLSDFQETLFMG